ncbi:MAG: single-stranded DNA-binding protein [Stellaceae bacterium]
MSLHALASGSLIADPQQRQGSKGPFTTATLRVSTGEGEAVLVSTIAFGDEGARLLDYRRGDALAISGRATLTAWTGRDGTERHGLSLVAEQIAAAKPQREAPGAPRARARPSAPRPAYARHRAAAAEPAGDGGRPFDDALDDIGVGR